MRGVFQIGQAAGFAVVGLAMSAQGALISSFENTGGPAGSTYSTNTGVTDGTYSCAKSYGPSWNQTALASYGALENLLHDNPVLKLDITVPGDSSTNPWLTIGFGVQGSNYNGTLTKYSPAIPTGFTGTAGVNKLTLAWDTTSLNLPTGASWFTVLLVEEGNVARTIYIDNLRAEAVPEPTSLAVLGLVSTALLRRRRGH